MSQIPSSTKSDNIINKLKWEKVCQKKIIHKDEEVVVLETESQSEII